MKKPSPGTGNQPDWDTLAEKFDHWLPQLAPVSDALIAALKPQPGDHILDVACGTGEPALSLARHMQSKINVIGTDAAPGMVKAAQSKVQHAGVNNIHFKCMPAEKLNFPTESFDAIISRFGIMLFDDPIQGLKEIHRVLKPGGRFAFAVWANPVTMTTLQWAYQVFDGRIPHEIMPPLTLATRLGSAQSLAETLSHAGYDHHDIKQHTFEYHFDSFEHYWQTILASDIMRIQFESLSHQEEKQSIYTELNQLALPYITNRGLNIPHSYLLAQGIKSVN